MAEIETIKTSRGELRYYRDWDNAEGAIVMLNPQTIERYKAIKETHPDADAIGVFFAFSDKQFNENRQKLIDLGTLAPDAKIKYHPSISGLYGTDESIGNFLAAYDDRAKLIPKECDPQEVYFYEWNNHETMYSWDGDAEANISAWKPQCRLLASMPATSTVLSSETTLISSTLNPNPRNNFKRGDFPAAFRIMNIIHISARNLREIA